MLSILHFAVLFGTYYTNDTTQPLAYEGIYSLSQCMSGLCFLASGIGCITGSLSGGRIDEVKVPTETRLGSMWLGTCILLCGILICVWLLEHRLSLVGVLVTQCFISFGMAFTFQSLSRYLINVFSTRSACIIGIQSFWRSTWAAVIVQLFLTMRSSIGWGWSYTIMFFLTLLSLALMQIVVFEGGALRQRFGLSTDIQ